MFKKAWLIFLLIFFIIATGCVPPNGNINSEEKSDAQKVTGVIPATKINKLAANINSKWPGIIWFSAQYMIMLDEAWATVIVLDNTVYTDDFVKEIVWLIAWEIQPKVIKVVLSKPDGVEELYFLNSGQEIRKGGAQNVFKHLTHRVANPIMFFSVDTSVNGFYAMDWQASNSTALNQLINKWRQKEEWRGRISIKANELFDETGKPSSLVYFVSFGFEGSSTELYLAETDSMLGKIVFDTMQSFSPSNILIFVLHGNGDTYVHYSMNERFNAFKKLVLVWPEGKTRKLWSSFFVVKPLMLRFPKS